MRARSLQGRVGGGIGIGEVVGGGADRFGDPVAILVRKAALPRSRAAKNRCGSLLVVAPPSLVDAVVIGDRARDQGFDLGRGQAFGGRVEAMASAIWRCCGGATASTRRPKA